MLPDRVPLDVRGAAHPVPLGEALLVELDVPRMVVDVYRGDRLRLRGRSRAEPEREQTSGAPEA